MERKWKKPGKKTGRDTKKREETGKKAKKRQENRRNWKKKLEEARRKCGRYGKKQKQR